MTEVSSSTRFLQYTAITLLILEFVIAWAFPFFNDEINEMMDYDGSKVVLFFSIPFFMSIACFAIMAAIADSPANRWAAIGLIVFNIIPNGLNALSYSSDLATLACILGIVYCFSIIMKNNCFDYDIQSWVGILIVMQIVRIMLPIGFSTMLAGAYMQIYSWGIMALSILSTIGLGKLILSSAFSGNHDSSASIDFTPSWRVIAAVAVPSIIGVATLIFVFKPLIPTLL